MKANLNEQLMPVSEAKTSPLDGYPAEKPAD